MHMKNNELIEQLSNLEMQKKSLLRELDKIYNNLDKRTKTFNKIKQIIKDIEQVKFKIRLEKEMNKNEKFREEV